MGIYPDLLRPRARAVARDALTVALLVLFAYLGIRVHHDVDQLSRLGQGVTEAGNSIRSALTSAASTVAGIPLAGGPISDALRSAAVTTGGGVGSIGRAGATSAHHLAVILGWLMWGLPSLLLLVLVLPRRIREIRHLRHLRRALRGPNAEERRRLLALRAALTLPEAALFARTADPAGDLLAGRYEPLAAAALEAGGVRADRAR